MHGTTTAENSVAYIVSAVYAVPLDACSQVTRRKFGDYLCFRLSLGAACYSRKKCGVNFRCLSWDDKQYILLRPTLRRVYWCHFQSRHVTVCSLDFLGLEYYRLAVSNCKQNLVVQKNLKIYGGEFKNF